MLLGLVGCDEGPPPFDELPLRDVLSASPDIVARLPASARSKLAQRFESARESDSSIDQADIIDDLPARTREERIDQARRQKSVEALIAGIIHDRAAWPIRERVDGASTALPALEGAPADTSAELEARALASNAGSVVRALLAASGAHRLQRVIGWPAAAVAIGDTVYVNASWLVSLSADDLPGLDCGVALDSSEQQAATSRQLAVVPAINGIAPAADSLATAGIAGSTATRADTVTYGYDFDAGVWTPPSYGSPSSPSSDSDPVAPADSGLTCADACGSCADAYASTNDGNADTSSAADDGAADSTDACSAADSSAADTGDADSCNTPSSDGADACAAPADTGDGVAACGMSGRRGTPSSTHTREAWLLAPLLFLLTRRRT